MKEQFLKLNEKLSVEAIQRTDKEKTKKGYDTDGYGYQFCVNRFNEVYEEKWGFDWAILKNIEGAYKSGQQFHEITVRLSIWVGSMENSRECVGGHVSATYYDALKGAITNAFKKTAAFWGVGRHAYEGTIDDDNTPLPDDNYNRVKSEIKRDIQTEIHSPKNETTIEEGKIDFALGCIYDATDIDSLTNVRKMLNQYSWKPEEIKALKDAVGIRKSSFPVIKTDETKATQQKLGV